MCIPKQYFSIKKTKIIRKKKMERRNRLKRRHAGEGKKIRQNILKVSLSTKGKNGVITGNKGHINMCVQRPRESSIEVR